MSKLKIEYQNQAPKNTVTFAELKNGECFILENAPEVRDHLYIKMWPSTTMSSNAILALGNEMCLVRIATNEAVRRADATLVVHSIEG